MDAPSRNKFLIAPLRAAMYDFCDQDVQAEVEKIIAPDAAIHLCHPLGDMTGADLYARAYAPLLDAIPDIERRDVIVTAGPDATGGQWVAACGHYTGTLSAPWPDIPPTGHLVHMRFHEFFRVENNRVVEMQAIWDIPELMMQAGVWPMAPSLGREARVPGPATQDGIVPGPWDTAKAKTSCDLIIDMLAHMVRHPSQGGPEVMEMERFWHPNMTWYGPAGIGTCRGIAGFRNWHQIPFLNAMPDRGQDETDITHHFFGDGDYAAVTGWPNMKQSLTGNGWLGLAPTGQMIPLRSLDFWRIEAGRIREIWVLVDLLDVYRQLGIDVFARLLEIAKSRGPGRIAYAVGSP